MVRLVVHRRQERSPRRAASMWITELVDQVIKHIPIDLKAERPDSISGGIEPKTEDPASGGVNEKMRAESDASLAVEVIAEGDEGKA